MEKITIDSNIINILMNHVSNIVTNNTSMEHILNNNKDIDLLNKTLNETNRDIKFMQNLLLEMTLVDLKDYISIDGVKIITNNVKIEINNLNCIKNLILNIIELNNLKNINIELLKKHNEIQIIFHQKDLKYDNDSLFTFIEEKNELIVIIEESISIIETLEIEIENFIFLLPLHFMVESIQPTKEMIKKNKEDDKKQILLLRDEFIPIIKLSDFFKINSNKKLENSVLIIVKYGEYKIALAVDRFIKQIQSSIKPLNINFVNVKGISSTSIRGNNEIGLILDIKSIIQELIKEANEK